MAAITSIKAYAVLGGLLKVEATAGTYDRDGFGNDHILAINPTLDEGGPIEGQEYDVKFNLNGNVREITRMTFNGFNSTNDARFDKP
ncbi:MAG: hypothetical protein HY819_18495 [Acidobacteria bacterium]|nr:hypothetical protein [Acidobacteriota bacterium]